MTTARVEWIARCACSSTCTTEFASDDEALTRRTVEHYRRGLQRPYLLIRRSTFVIETVIEGAAS